MFYTDCRVFCVFDWGTQVQAFKVVIFLFFLFAKPLGGSFSSNTLKRCLLQLSVTLGMPSFIFALLQFLSTLSTLWSTFCCDAGKGFWGYSRIWKRERSFQVQYVMEILPVQGCCVKQFQTTNFSSWSMWGFYAMHNPHGHTWLDPVDRIHWNYDASSALFMKKGEEEEEGE